MQDALLMRGLESARNLVASRTALRQATGVSVWRSKYSMTRKSISTSVFRASSAARPIVKGADVRLVRRSDGARFSLEAVACLQIVRELLRQHFDRYRPVEPCIARLVDLTHSTGANQRRDLIVA